MNWNLFLTELVSGITHGSVYALIALGYSMVYGILKLLNFAHGDVYMVGSFIGFGLITVFGGAEALSTSIWLLLLLMFFCAMLGGGLLGVLIERFAYRRLRNAPRIAPLITALGVSFFLENAALLVLGAQYQSYNTFAWKGGELWRNGFTLPSGVHVAVAQIIVVIGAVVLMVFLTLFVQRTQLGKAMRATSFDREAAAMMGIDVDRVIVATFFIGSALAGAAGVFNGLAYQQVWPYMGFQAGLYAFIAAVVGGIGNLPGAVVGGLVIGLAQAFSIGYISSTFSDAIVFAVLIVVMVVRPSGVLGRAAVQKV
ncbi:MAG TPA: branched-chain amino acid ABC transporter permease [Gaiellaceae bacterium]|jgi:branched-chain amino acid transport system permease protein|nr:branched-chain amino acid ABC transporter permease [Gaiellaceae bacterium]